MKFKKVIMFGGKGGVGKSTLSASVALYFASHNKKTLILSSDPAPSLSDIFETKLESIPKKIEENLYGMEISEDEILRRWKEKFGKDIYEVFSAFFDVDYDIVDYIGTAPGIEEEFLLDYIFEIFKGNEYDYIVWDTAPMGHTLKLLSMPSKFIEHLNLATKFYAKFYKFKKRSIFDIINEWKLLSEEIIKFLRTEVNVFVVTTPQKLSIMQTERFIKNFENYEIKISGIVLNNIIKIEDQEYLSNFKKKYKKLIEIPFMQNIEKKDLLKIAEKFENAAGGI